MARAFVCPGQGAQSIGMGKALADTYTEAKVVFQEVDEALGEPLSQLIWDGNLETLTLTENAQPALMATSLAAFRALESEGISLRPGDFVAGHSLGEYSALAIAGALSVADTACLLRARGKAMQAAVPVGVGAMAALLGLNFEAASEVAAEAAGAEVCQAANDNDPGQVVVSGNTAAVERAVEIAKSKGLKVNERKIAPTELSNFVGCFLTGTAAEVTPVSCIAENQFKVCKTIIDLNESYQALVRKKVA